MLASRTGGVRDTSQPWTYPWICWRPRGTRSNWLAAALVFVVLAVWHGHRCAGRGGRQHRPRGGADASVITPMEVRPQKTCDSYIVGGSESDQGR